MKEIKIFRITTVPISLQKLIGGQLPFMKSNGFEPIMISSEGIEVEQVIEEQQCMHVPVALTRKITPLADLKALWQFYRLCKLYKPIIIHSHTPKAGIIGMLGGRLAGVPVRLHTVAGLPLMESNGIKRSVLNAVEKFTYASATKVYPNSIVLKDYILKSRFCGPDKVKVIGSGSSNGIDTSYFCKEEISSEIVFSLKKKLKIVDGDFLFLFIGRIVRDKGIQELINAFKYIQNQFNNCKLLLVGPLEHDLDPLDEVILREIQNNPTILAVGYQNDVRPYLAISNVLVFPSYREGFPNVPMQAGCFNLPSIVTNINGCNEIIIQDENGLIIEPKSVDDLKKAMKKLIVNKELYKQMQSNARRMIIERYEQRYFWELLLKEYREQLALANK